GASYAVSRTERLRTVLFARALLHTGRWGAGWRSLPEGVPRAARAPRGCARGLGSGGSDPSGPFVVHVVVVHLGGARPQVDGPGEASEDGQEDDHAHAAADAVGEPVREGADHSGRGKGEQPGG